MFGNKLINTNAGGGCTDTVDLYNPFPDGGGLALYQLNGNANDVSGNYNGTASNVTYGTGVFGQAGVFNGNAYISTLGSISGSQDFTISLWVNPATNTDIQNSLFTMGTATNNGFFIYRYNQQIAIDSFGATRWTEEGFFTENAWQHLTITHSSGTNNVYLNGSFYATFSYTWNIDSSATTYIGAQIYSYTRYLTGSLDQVRVFSRALRPYEVEALYTEEYCTPTIVPSEHFNTVTYTGNGGTQSITGVGFQPDFVWAKKRSAVQDHIINDSVRGVQKELVPNNTSAEYTTSNGLSSFDSDGFTTGANNALNTSGSTYVAWNFKAGGAEVAAGGTNLTNRFVSANPEAGFSIMTYTGSGTDGTIEHGLNAKPELWIFKNLSVAKPWFTLTNIIDGSVDYGFLNTTDAFNNAGQGDATDTILNVNLDGGSGFLNANGNNYVAYAFHSVEGFSNFGSYVGNGSTSGPTVVTGFEPAFIMFKRTSADASGGNWIIKDNKRDISNPNTENLYANLSAAEEDAYPVDFLENGFQIKETDVDINKSGGKYIYMAFAADPTTIEPSLEDSFNTVLYTGNGAATQVITGVGFQPDFTWTKCRSNVEQHGLFDSVRGANLWLNSGGTEAETDYGGNFGLLSWSDDGFTVGNGSAINASGRTYVAWNWKGAELPAINSNGSIPSVVSANPAAGFSIVSLTIPNNNTQSVGHGLDAAPSVIIMKARDAAESWLTYHSSVGLNKYLLLDSTAAQSSYTGIWSDVNSSTFTTLYHSAIGSPTRNVIAYCFAEVAGFSKFGSFSNIGSGTLDFGFEPAFVLIKTTAITDNWRMYDNKRDTVGINSAELYPNLSNAEYTATNFATFTSTGLDFSGGNTFFQTNDFIYMAFANQF